MARRELNNDYKFLPILDAMSAINQKVNIIGVVMETSIPRQTRGTDCFCTMKIVDESCAKRGISVNFFAENMERLPQVIAVGDIIQLSHVVIKTHGSELYALFNKKFSSFALFDGKHGTNFAPYQACSKFRLREQDKKFIASLRKWLVDYQLDTGPDNSKQLKDLGEGESFSLICKILHICEVTKDEWMIFVWDGTDTPPLTIQTKLEDEMLNPLPLTLESFNLPRDILCTFPTLGTVLRVTVEQGNEKLGLHLIKTGKWVKLGNMSCKTYKGLWLGVLMLSTRLLYLPDDHHLVLQHQRSYGMRLASKGPLMPLWCFPWHSRITEADFPNVPFVTLMDVLTYSEVTAKFRCVVRVLAAFPWQAKDFCSPLGTYRIRLTLEDPTARVHAFLYAEDGVEFFGGYPSVDVMTRNRNRLLGVAESDDGNQEIKDAPRNPPWVECCLKSYYIDKSDIWGSRNYRIFATRIEG